MNGKLTRRRRIPVALATLVSLPATVAHGDQWHPVNDIAGAAESFIAGQFGHRDGRMTVRATPLDARTQLARCDQPLAAELTSGPAMRKRMTVRVGCNGSRPWKIYVTANVIVTESVLVVARSLPRDHVLTETDLVAAERDVSRLTRGYVTRAEDVVGRELKRQVIEGSVLVPGMMKSSVMIRRGQSVTITVQNDALNITMAGKALMDGAENQRIRVENLTSQRVVEAIVRSPEHVEVLVF